MILIFLFFALYASAAEITKTFLEMREHFQLCPLNCNSSECVQKEQKITDPWYKNIFKQVYCTYHCISEITANAYGLSTDFRYFINFYGEFLACKQDAQTKNALVLLKRDEEEQNTKQSDKNKRKLEQQQKMGFIESRNRDDQSSLHLLAQNMNLKTYFLNYIYKGMHIFSFLRETVPAVAPNMRLFGQGVMCGFTFGFGMASIM